MSSLFQPSKPHRSTLTELDLISAATIDAVAGTYNELGRFTVAFGEGQNLGFGVNEGQHSAEGRVYVDLQDDLAAALSGILRLEVRNPRDRSLEIVWESPVDVLRTSATDPRQQVPFPAIEPILFFEHAFVLMYLNAAAVTVSRVNSTIAFAATAWEARLGRANGAMRAAAG